MTEFGTAFGAAFVALAWSVWSGRELFARHKGLPDQRAPWLSLQAAPSALLGPSTRTLAALAVLLAFLGFVGFGVVRAHAAPDPAASPLEMGAWLAVPFLLGVGVTAASAHIAAWVGVRFASRGPQLGRGPLTESLPKLITASAFGAFLPAFLSLVVLLGLCAVAFASAGGFAAAPSTTGIPALRMALLVVAFGAGAALGALFARLVHGLYSASSCQALAADILASRREPRNVARVDATCRNLLGGALAFGGQHVVDLVASLSLVGASALLPAAVLANSNGGRLHSPAAATLFPILALGFGLVCSVLASTVVRCDEAEDLLAPIGRGLVVCVVLCTAALFGLAHWVFDDLWLGPFLSSAVGLAVGVTALVVGRALDVQASPRAARHPGSAAMATLLGTGFVRASVLIGAGLVCFVGGWNLVGLSGFEHGGPYGAAAAVVGFASLAPYVLVAQGFGSMGSALAAGPAPEEVSRASVSDRTARLRWAALRSLAACRAYGVLAAVLAGMLAALSFSIAARLYAEPVRAAAGADTRLAVIAGAAIVGVVLVAFAAGHVLRAIGRLVRTAASAADSEGEALQDEVGSGAVQPVRGLSWAWHAHAAVRQAAASMLVLLGSSAAAWLVVNAFAGQATVRLSVESTSALLVAATAVGGVLSTVLDGPASGARDCPGVREEPSGVGKSTVDATPDSANNLLRGAVVVSDTPGVPFGYVAGPALHALARLLPAVVVALAPLLH